MGVVRILLFQKSLSLPTNGQRGTRNYPSETLAPSRGGVPLQLRGNPVHGTNTRRWHAHGPPGLLGFLDCAVRTLSPSRLPQRQGQTLGQTQIGSGALGALGECSRQPLRSRGLFFYCLILLVRRSSPSPRRGMRHIRRRSGPLPPALPLCAVPVGALFAGFA